MIEAAYIVAMLLMAAFMLGRQYGRSEAIRSIKRLRAANAYLRACLKEESARVDAMRRDRAERKEAHA